MTDPSQGAPEVTPDLRLRPERPRVTRLSRKVLIGLSAVSGLAIAAALIYALQTRNADQSAQELYSIENRPTADGLTGLPRDYTGVPKLGPPLPGDLGRPILSAQNQGQPVPSGGPLPQPGMTPEEQRRLQEIEAARLSKLFAATAIRVSAPITAAAASSMPGTTHAVPAEAPPLDPNAMQNMQDRKLAFVNGPVDRRTVSQDRLANPASPYVVQAGTVIPAALLTGIQSDLPGQITAQVTEHVYDTPTGKFLLIPQGSRLIGQYDSQVSFGQKRVLLVWNRIMLPDGKSIVLERQQGADARGLSGLEDEVDYHWWDLIKAAALSTLLSVGAELGSDRDESDLVRALRRGSQDSINNTGQQLVRRQLNIQPTLTIRQGFPVRVIVNRDLVMAPYGQQEASR
ncbi:TrbI/VirB10 family protein [Pseudorhodoplanes sinuspersici]|uniref:Conjugal transfer protein TraI n=1 Tax=Pseudorhodoplanes sinuspersici TaxID=1235591 RepID=A0A1W6ZLQ5_9HYPH|nr:TrbI/VirB10 family protein [Pseudorhodoplanes sinuspersici]ARP98040.1 conjugal transfer protein TraI [Pseudorhodoplanes sinuspersici]RKE68206.1 type IV secretion system protein VirB10 [Pseudorhodoplanes sinuspersici]